jgi:phosphopantothenoylcysteine decarboxylase/phosphopantothenate--cysteine ligase
MGFAIAEVLADRGAEVQLVCGPTHQHTNHPGINVIQVTSAAEMYEACTTRFDAADITVLAAAVADYRPVTQASEKIKKNDAMFTLELTRTHDIAAELGKRKRDSQVTVGFALETNNERPNALKKLNAKNFDLIVLNSLQDEGAGFGHDTNKVTIIDKHEQAITFELKDKRAVADDIVDAIVGYSRKRSTIAEL